MVFVTIVFVRVVLILVSLVEQPSSDDREPGGLNSVTDYARLRLRAYDFTLIIRLGVQSSSEGPK